MPRIALTKEQKEQQILDDMYKKILDGLNMARGLSRKTKLDYCKELGISKTTWQRWDKGELAKAEFATVLRAALRAGLKVEVSGP